MNDRGSQEADRMAGIRRVRARRQARGRTLFLGLMALFATSSAAWAAPVCEAEMLAAAKRHELPVSILYAVALTETGGRDGLQAFALNIDGHAVFPADLAAALATVERARTVGARFIDIGCMQINLRYHGHEFASVAAMFEPSRNVDYAARFLKRLRARESNWTLAVARYNAGPGNNPAQRKYVCAVIGNLARSGFGSWTPAARRFCETQAAHR